MSEAEDLKIFLQNGNVKPHFPLLVNNMLLSTQI